MGEIPNEDDAYISHTRDGYSLSIEGHYIETFPREMRARAAVSLWSRYHNFYPNLWIIDERGSVEISSYW